MERATDVIFPPLERPRAGGLQGETERTGPSSQGSYFNSYGTGDQFNAPEGKLNIAKGSGVHLPGAISQQPVYFGTKEHFDPLRECLRSLAFPEMDSRSNDIDAAAKGTCLLWIKGNPGSGKSTLLGHVLRNVVATPTIAESDLILSFFFHGRGSDLQRTPLGLFRSLLHQLLRQVPEALSDHVASFQQRCETVGKPGEKWQWHPRELQRFFESSLLNVLRTRPVWLFVDALDECGEESAVELVDGFQSLIQTLPTIGLKHFHVCFTCRHYPILEVDCALQICAEDENRDDISTFVHYKLSSFSSTIPDLITSRAQGVFLWAWLVVKQVLSLKRKGVGLKKMEAKVRSVPQELDDLYRELIRNMGPDSLKIIEWICFATRPLALDELRWAMLVDADCPHQSLYECQTAGDYPSNHDGMKRRVQTLSCGLAEVESDMEIVQFIHQSVKDFFVEKGLSALDGTTKPDFVVETAHHRLSRTCICYLAMEEISRLASHEPYYLRSRFPFLHYATTSWVAHTKQSDTRSIPQEDLLECFTWPSNTLVERWVRVYGILQQNSGDCPPEGTTLVHVMSRYGVAGALGAILERAGQSGINIDTKDSNGRTPLSWAARGGHEVVVQLLLKTGKFDVARWPKAVVRILLLATGKADVDTKDMWGRTPLSYAAENGHEAVVRLLLDRGAHTKAADKWGRTPLWRAAENGHAAVVRLLLDGGAHTEAADKWGRTPLWRAAANRHEAVVRLLLDGCAHTEAADETGRTPLFRAAENGHAAVVRLLLDGVAHAEAVDETGRTPLWRAAENGHAAVVRLLQVHVAQPSSTMLP